MAKRDPTLAATREPSLDVIPHRRMPSPLHADLKQSRSRYAISSLSALSKAGGYNDVPIIEMADGTEITHSQIVHQGGTNGVFMHFNRSTGREFDSARRKLSSCT